MFIAFVCKDYLTQCNIKMLNTLQRYADQDLTGFESRVWDCCMFFQIHNTQVFNAQNFWSWMLHLLKITQEIFTFSIFIPRL